MAVLHRALLTWFLGLIFLILLVIRLDQRTQWNWFIVFIPMWIFDLGVLTYAAFYIVSRCRHDENHRHLGSFLRRQFFYILGVVFKLVLQVLICLKLEAPTLNLHLYYVLIPFWAILSCIMFRMIKHLYDAAVPSDKGNNEAHKLVFSAATNSSSSRGIR